MSNSPCQQIVMIGGALSFGEGLHQLVTPELWSKDPYMAYVSLIFYTALGIALMWTARREMKADELKANGANRGLTIKIW